MANPEVTIRACHSIDEFEAMVDLEVAVWGFGERDAVPSQMYVVAVKTGGQAFGAYLHGRLVGFALAYAGIRNGFPYLHSHMAGVLPEFRDWGIGRRLKMAQREDALSKGISLIEWTFDPLQARNAHFNICRLGVLCRRYLLNVYGETTSPLHGGLPTDRLVAEWHLDSGRVKQVLAGERPNIAKAAEAVRIEYDDQVPQSVASAQESVRTRFQELFERGLEVTWFERDARGGSYLLEPAGVIGQ